MGRTGLGMVAAFGLLVAVCASCAGGYSRADRLQLRVDQFNNQVRWGRFHSAAEFFRDEEARRAWLDVRREWGQDLQIADYEIVESAEGDDGTTVVRVVVSWYRLSQSELHTTMFAQRWRLEDREWHLLSEEVEEGTPL